jgi:hydroxypyruvate isomerase
MYTLAACAEMLFLELPIQERARRIHDLGFGVEIWDWTRHDLAALERSGAVFSSMTGYLRGSLTDEDGAAELIRTAAESAGAAARLGCPRLNLHGTGLDGQGLPAEPVTGEPTGPTFTLENLNTAVDHPGVPFARAADTLALVAAVGRPGLRMNLDLYHAQIGEGNLIALLRQAHGLGLIGEVQVADVPGRCEPGTGEISYPAIARVLAELGYDGTVAMEAWAAEDSELALERFRSAFTPVTLSARGGLS